MTYTKDTREAIALLIYHAHAKAEPHENIWHWLEVGQHQKEIYLEHADQILTLVTALESAPASKDAREAIAGIVHDYASAYDDYASEPPEEIADRILTALEPAPQAGGDVREALGQLIQDYHRLSVRYMRDGTDMGLEQAEAVTNADPAIIAASGALRRAALTATPAQPDRGTPDKVALKNKIVSAILSYPPDTMSKAEFMADQILAAIPAQPTPSGEVDGLVAEIEALAKIFPVEIEETPDYANVIFNDCKSQCMTLEPHVWLKANEEVRTALGGGWRDDMENAPRDGSKVDLIINGLFRLPDCKWGKEEPHREATWLNYRPHPDALHDWEWQEITSNTDEVTHWMKPVPVPPPQLEGET
tara:strand:- start:3219 stop:4301 length:1083 start_codon:yes stop_codon:yes gene_type:complete